MMIQHYRPLFRKGCAPGLSRMMALSGPALLICVAAGGSLACTSTSPHLYGGGATAPITTPTTSTTPTTDPAITTAPMTTTVTAGQSATFTVAATGATTLHYQWQDNGVNVGTDAPTYTLALPKPGNSGDSVTVTVTDVAGSVTSSASKLTVNPLVVTLPGNLPLDLTAIAAGTFTMGAPDSDPDANANTNHDEGPQHQVTISENFYIGTYLVTQAQWSQIMGSNPSYFSGPQRPVEQVSYTDITAATTGFLALLNQNATASPALPPGYVFRLPTEAEWEYACRAGTTTRFYWGDFPDTDPTINAYAWYSGDAGGTTHIVGGLLPNAWGLYDMAGNVYEWCQDWYDPGYYSASPLTDPVGPSTSPYSARVIRGGTWPAGSFICRPAYRGNILPSAADSGYGFRVVLAPPRLPPPA